MPITRNFTSVDVANFINVKKEAYLKAVEDRFKIAGEQAVAYMRSLNTFQDQTANLRNSEGFMIYRDGKPIMESYPNDAKHNIRRRRRGEILSSTEIRKRASKGQGASAGKQLAKEVARQYAPDEGFLLVVTAGMFYAVYVEAKGYDVITGGAKMTVKYIKKAMEDLNKKVS